MNRAVIGIDSNIGREKNFKTAFLLLRKVFPGISFSKVVETAPVGFKSKKKFLNAVAKAFTKKSKKEIVLELKEMEKAIGRKKRKKKASSREIDLDLLLFNKRTANKTVFDSYNTVCLTGFLSKKEMPKKLADFLEKQA